MSANNKALARKVAPVPLKHLMFSVHISLKHKYIFVETPKVACSSIKLTLQRWELEDSTFRPCDFEDIHHKSPLLSPKDVDNFLEMLDNSAFVKFCFVRHPYTRLVSCYLDKICRNQRHKESILATLGLDTRDLSQELSFAAFVDGISRQSIREMDPHWRPQYFQTFQHAMSFDMIGRFESFATDFAKVADKLGGDVMKYFLREDRNQTNASLHAAEVLTDDIRKKLSEIYAVDLKNFSYHEDSLP